MQECSMYFWRIFFYFFPYPDKSSILFSCSMIGFLFELAKPNSTGKTILTVLVWETCDANVVLQNSIELYEITLKVPSENSFFHSPSYFIKYNFTFITLKQNNIYIYIIFITFLTSILFWFIRTETKLYVIYTYIYCCIQYIINNLYYKYCGFCMAKEVDFYI